MKVAIINFSGNVGKTTIARQLLAPRMQATQFAVETINVGASDDAGATERIRGKEFGSLQEELMQIDSAIVDIGASNVEEFIKLMAQFAGSHEEFDYFVVPVVAEKKQQADSINTIKTLSRIGVPANKIRVVFNKVDPDDANDLPRQFGMLCGFFEAEKKFTFQPQAVLFANEVFDRLRTLKINVADLVMDATDYRAALRSAPSDEARQHAVRMLSAKRLAASAHQNLEDVFQVLFQ
jgi:hypothetical protein